MKRLFFALVVVCPLVPSAAHAQYPTPSQFMINCGQIRTANDAHQWGQFGNFLEYIVSTTRDANTCPLTVDVQAYVPGVQDSGASEAGFLAASVRRQVRVPYAGRWQSTGLHGVTLWLPAIPLPLPIRADLPDSASVTIISEPEPEPVEFDSEYVCEQIEGGSFEDGHCIYPNCPIMLDTARDGFKLTNVENGVRFDLDADGIPEQVAWTRLDSDDAFLAFDRNGNGLIDDGTELFGNHTPARPDWPATTTANGFEALKFVETTPYGASDMNEVITARDAAFARLLLWRDRNHNGVSEPDELQSLADAGVEAVYTDYKNSKRVDKHGNEFRQRSRVKWNDGQFDQTFDVWLRWRR
jgi:hypothetical protein